MCIVYQVVAVQSDMMEQLHSKLWALLYMSRCVLFKVWASSFLLFAVLFGALVILPNAASAQENQAGLSISPAIIESDNPIDPGTTLEHSVTVKNLNNSEQTFYLSTRNIVDMQDGTPVFSENNEKTGMEMSEWIKLPVSQITIPAGASEQVVFKMEVPADATPGSHFGSIFISVDPPDIEKSGAAVGYKVANILIARISGEANDSANIRQFATKKFFHGSKNVDFSLRMENLGNVLVKPTGPVEISNMLGQKVDMFIFNEEQASVFPGRVREYSFNWTGEGTGFGRYEALISTVYGDNGAKKTLSSTVSFWILPMNIILPALGALLFILLVTFIFVKLYIRRTLAHLSHGQGRIVRKRRQRGLPATLLLTVVMLTVTAVFMIALLVLFA
jgi:hypothetical protein